jgi:osmotically-inducible protein OsmY
MTRHATEWSSVLGPAAGLVLALGCERQPSSPPPPAPDNTARRAADRGSGIVTPTDQGESAEDRRITADIRKSVMADSALSTNAHNCKIVTRNGAVTLRGPVDTQAEKDAIEKAAKAVTGVTSVQNDLEVTPK